MDRRRGFEGRPEANDGAGEHIPESSVTVGNIPEETISSSDLNASIRADAVTEERHRGWDLPEVPAANGNAAQILGKHREELSIVPFSDMSALFEAYVEAMECVWSVSSRLQSREVSVGYEDAHLNC